MTTLSIRGLGEQARPPLDTRFSHVDDLRCGRRLADFLP